MARRCHCCGKGNISGHSISHALNHTKRIWKPNLKRIKLIDEDNVVRRKFVCTRCIRSQKVNRA